MVMLKASGFKNVSILDGGLAKWRAKDCPMESGAAQVEPTDTPAFHDTKGVVSKADVLALLGDESSQIIDARAADRVFGSGIDPVHGGQNGRIPGALNLPFGEVFAEDGTYKSPEDLRAAIEGAGVNLAKPIITSCGSGVTASVLLFALHLTGHDEAQLYDGSWQEWEADPDTPKQQGPAA